VDVDSKEEAIKVMVNRLFVVGRIKESREVEELIWQREQTYSTGFGHGFAIPHCKTNAIRANSLVVIKLTKPVDWNALDGQPVRVVILLVIREVEGPNGHMKIFATLARKMMDEDFRSQVERETDAAKLCKVLANAVYG
jgi:fructose-specific phosphotransferase system IIA component